MGTTANACTALQENGTHSGGGSQEVTRRSLCCRAVRALGACVGCVCRRVGGARADDGRRVFIAERAQVSEIDERERRRAGGREAGPV